MLKGTVDIVDVSFVINVCIGNKDIYSTLHNHGSTRSKLKNERVAASFIVHKSIENIR